MPHDETSLIRARRPSVVKIQEEEQIEVPAGLNFFAKMIEWAPLLCFLLIDNATYAYTAAFGVVVFQVFVSYVQHKRGEFLEWPKPLEIIFVVVFGLLTTLAWIYQESVETIEEYSGPAINAGLALGFFVSWLLSRPVVRGYQVDKLGEERASHPILVHMASWLSVMFTVVFSSIAVIGALWPEGDWTFLICNLAVGGAFLTAYKIYPAYVKNHTEEMAALYADEIAEWEAKHPELNFDGEMA